MSDKKPMMGCGHTANSVNRTTGKPCCVICIGIVDGADIEQVNPPSLANRQARCSCLTVVPSSQSLAFFEYRGPGSFAALSCKNCGWKEEAHTTGCYKNSTKPIPGLCITKGSKYEPHSEGYEYDAYYCGHSGFD